tara:strand:- start:1974 stop:2348 length:375 start_codon:yes stop_codon:yes gene_type:complete
MDVSTSVPEGLQVVDSYGPGRFRIASVVWSSCVIVTPEQTVEWPISSIIDVNADSLRPIFSADPGIEVLLIGTGKKMERIPNELRECIRTQGVGVDSMDTGAACRTYNVLLAEGRRVAAALMLV